MAPAIFAQCRNKITSYREFITLLMPENFKIIAVKSVKAITGAKPHKTLTVLYTAKNRIV
jgi:hypothetical protein